MDAGPTPSVSVGMPVYNGAAWVEASVRSILEQTYTDFELIISDNASSDATAEICQRLADTDRRVRFIQQETNVGANRNYLCVQRAARGRYFKWASANDICRPTFIERCVAALEADPGAILASPLVMVFEDDPASAKIYDHGLSLLHDSPGQRLHDYFNSRGLNNAFNGIIRRDVLNACRPLGVYRAADIVLMAELALRGKFLEPPERFFLRRISPDAATTYRSTREADLHLVATTRTPLRYQHWIYHANLLRAAVRAVPLGPEWLRGVDFALRSILWSRRDLAADIREVLTGRSA